MDSATLLLLTVGFVCAVGGFAAGELVCDRKWFRMLQTVERAPDELEAPSAGAQGPQS